LSGLLDIEEPLDKIRREITESFHLLFSVGQGSIDNLLDVLQAKEFLAHTPSQIVDLQTLLHQPLYVPESINALKALEVTK